MNTNNPLVVVGDAVKRQRYVRTYTNPVTGRIVVSEPEGPPLAYFKRGEEAKAAEFIKAWKPT